MTRSKQAVGYLLLVFLLGAAMGAGGLYWANSSELVKASKKEPKKEKTSTEWWLGEKLDLSPEQRKQLGAILDETRENYDSIWEEVGPRFNEARQDGRKRIRAILNEEQREKFEKLVRHIDMKEKASKQKKGRWKKK